MKSIRVSHIPSAFREITRMISLSNSTPVQPLLQERMANPIDYMRWVEFDEALHGLCLPPQGRVLDVGSPQWFTLALARRRPDVNFTYGNIDPAEVTPFREIAAAAKLTNANYQVADARTLPFADAAFDRVFSLSVIEHVAPEQGGDALALSEFRRVLKPGGEVRLTLPFKDRAAVVRSADGGFYAREYDQPSLDALLQGSGLTVKRLRYISERPGWLAPDYHEWGPGRDTPAAERYRRWRKQLEWRFRRSLDPWLAAWYLRMSDEPRPRLVNAALVLGS